MSDISIGEKLAQHPFAAVSGNACENLVFCHTSDGNDGNRGETPEHAVKTLTRAQAPARRWP
jgi:hypothetical protein